MYESAQILDTLTDGKGWGPGTALPDTTPAHNWNCYPLTWPGGRESVCTWHTSLQAIAMGPYIVYNQLKCGATSTLGTWPFSFLAGDYLLFFLSPEAGLVLLAQLAGYAVQRFSASLFSYEISPPNNISCQSPILKTVNSGSIWHEVEVYVPKLAISTSFKFIAHTYFRRHIWRIPRTLSRNSLI